WGEPRPAAGRSRARGVARRLGLGDRPRGACAAAVPDRAHPAEGAALAPVLTLASVDDDGHVRVVPVVLDHLVVELVLELPRDHAVDHLLRIVGTAYERARRGCRTNLTELPLSRLAAGATCNPGSSGRSRSKTTASW